jgi:hypothetical protein
MMMDLPFGIFLRALLQFRSISLSKERGKTGVYPVFEYPTFCYYEKYKLYRVLKKKSKKGRISPIWLITAPIKFLSVLPVQWLYVQAIRR